MVFKERKEKKMKKISEKYEKYLLAGITAFCVVAAALILKLIFDNLGAISQGIHMVNSALKPVYIGLIISFLLSPLVNKSDQYIFLPLMHKIIKREKTAGSVARGLSVAVVILLSLLVVFSLVMMVVPEVVHSIASLVNNMPSYYRNLVSWGDRVFKSNPYISNYFDQVSQSVYQKFLSWLQNDLLPNSNKLLSTLTDGITNLINVLMNFLIGIIISVYLMAGKENFCAQAKKLMYALFPVHWVEGALDVLSETHTVFAKFISGKLIDSLIVGILTFIIMSIAGVPYTVLISVIIGVTNVLPYFGPYIGTIPCAILILIANPMKGILFIVLIIILQQFDGNILGPMILGDSIGLKSFWILFSILFFGSLFGLVGMVCAVPVFAMIYRWVKRWCNRRLSGKGIPVETAHYRSDPQEKKVIEKKK